MIFIKNKILKSIFLQLIILILLLVSYSDVSASTSLTDTTAPVTTISITGTSVGAGVYYGPIQIQLTASDDISGVQKTEYSLDNGTTWNLYTDLIQLSVPKVYTFKYRSTDNNNNIEAVKSQKITIKSDTTPPTTQYSLSGTKGNGLYYVSSVVVQLTATDDYSGVNKTEYSQDGGATWTTYLGPFTLSDNKPIVLFYRSIDNNNNIEASKSTKIYIDTIAPTQPSIIFNPLIWTNSNVTVSIYDGIDNGSGSLKSQYRLSSSGAWIDYIDPFILTTADTVYAQTIDVAGNYSLEANDEPKIDKIPPSVPQIILSSSSWTSNDVTVQLINGIDQDSQILKSQYKIGTDGDWVDYSYSFQFSSEGVTTIFARSVDNAGNISAEISTFIKIDKTPPMMPNISISNSNWTNQDVTFTVADGADSLSGVQKSQYKVGNSGNWVDFLSPISINTEGITMIYARSIDFAGNIGEETSIPIKIDKTPPSVPTIMASNTNWTNQNVIFSITPGTDALSGLLKSQYKIGAAGVWTDYSDMVTVSTEGQTPVFARSIDNAGNNSIEATVTIKIDKTPPSSPGLVSSSGKTGTTVDLIWGAATDNIGIAQYNIYDGTAFVAVSNFPSYRVMGLTPNTLHNFTVKAQDLAGNVSVASGAYKVFNNDPIISAFRSYYSIKNNGTVWAWGDDSYGKLGDSNTTTLYSPVQVSGLSNFVSISSGDKHALGLMNDGTVWAWGSNLNGNLGNSTDSQSYTPKKVTQLLGMTAVSAGLTHSLALKGDGTVWAWGTNSYGELGNSTNNSSSTPLQASGLNSVIAISASYYHSLALKSDGTVWAWGGNGNGQLGNGTTSNINHPIQISAISNIIAIAAGPTQSLALKADGTVWAWGNVNLGPIGDGNSAGRTTPVQVASLGSVVSIALGHGQGVALKDDGSVWAWGANSQGQVGDGSTTDRLTPVRVSHVNSATGVFAGEGSTMITRADGSVWVWGNNNYGGLGNNGTSLAVKTTRINIPNIGYSYSDLVSPAAPSLSNTGKTGSSVQLSWSEATDNFGIIGYDIYNGTTLVGSTIVDSNPSLVATSYAIGSLSPNTTYTFSVKAKDFNGNVSAASNSVSVTTNNASKPVISAGDSHVELVKADNTLWAWGSGANGKIGDSYNSNRLTSVQISSIVGVTSVSAGLDHTIALKSDGTVWAWGANLYGQLGDSTAPSTSFTPRKIPSLANVVAISAGNNHNLALKSDGTLWAWGNNSYGQVGNNSTSTVYNPVQVLTNVKAISAGWLTSIALKNDGTVWVWGGDTYGQLGDGLSTQKNIPSQMTSLSSIAKIAMGGNNGLALKNDGTVLAWGTGYIGNGTSASKSVPVAVTGISSVTDISVGIDHNLALKSDGTVWAWGFNSFGQLGDTTVTSRPNATQVSNLTNVTNIDAGSYFSVAIKSDGTVWSWGKNSAGQLGNNTLTNSSTRVQVSNLNTNPSDTSVPTAPTNLVSTFKTSTTVDLSWTAATDNIGVAGYDIYRGATLVGSSTGVNFTAVGLASNTAYTFTVKARDAGGNISSASNSVTVTTL
jgi:alpha-tubulin suppressor-like RCC1 family protein